MAPTVIGIDISHHQGAVNWFAMKNDGVVFAGIKATEGDGFRDSRFAANLRMARAAGVIPFAYHYQRSTSTAAEQVAHIRRVVPRDCPVVPDVEHGSGNVALTRGIVSGLRRAGYTVPLSYIPRWYWQGIGSPSLTGLPPLWSSRYPDNRIRPIRDEYREIEARFMHFWTGYGGLNVAVLQFTSSARVGGRSPIDGNAFRGSLTQLRSLLGGKGPAPSPPTQEDDLSAKAEAQIDQLHKWYRKGIAGDGPLGEMAGYLIEVLRRTRASEVRENTLIRLVSAQSGITEETIRTIFRQELDRVRSEFELPENEEAPS